MASRHGEAPPGGGGSGDGGRDHYDRDDRALRSRRRDRRRRRSRRIDGAEATAAGGGDARREREASSDTDSRSRSLTPRGRRGRHYRRHGRRLRRRGSLSPLPPTTDEPLLVLVIYVGEPTQLAKLHLLFQRRWVRSRRRSDGATVVQWKDRRGTSRTVVLWQTDSPTFEHPPFGEPDVTLIVFALDSEASWRAAQVRARANAASRRVVLVPSVDAPRPRAVVRPRRAAAYAEVAASLHCEGGVFEVSAVYGDGVRRLMHSLYSRSSRLLEGVHKNVAGVRDFGEASPPRSPRSRSRSRSRSPSLQGTASESDEAEGDGDDRAMRDFAFRGRRQRRHLRRRSPQAPPRTHEERDRDRDRGDSDYRDRRSTSRFAAAGERPAAAAGRGARATAAGAMSAEMREQDRILAEVQLSVEETKRVANETMDMLVAHGEALDNLVDKSSELRVAARSFSRHAKSSRRMPRFFKKDKNLTRKRVPAPAVSAGEMLPPSAAEPRVPGAEAIDGLPPPPAPVVMGPKVVEKTAKVSEMFDNVLADTETAFQWVAGVLAWLLPATASVCRKLLLPVSFLVAYFGTMFGVLTLFLPSFFVLLLIRTTKVETESAAFGVRQEVIIRETCMRKALRWIALLVRAAPMTAFLILWPLYLVYVVLANDSDAEHRRTMALVCITAHCGFVWLLQALGTVRAAVSWRKRQQARGGALGADDESDDDKTGADAEEVLTDVGTKDTDGSKTTAWAASGNKFLCLKRKPARPATERAIKLAELDSQHDAGTTARRRGCCKRDSAAAEAAAKAKAEKEAKKKADEAARWRGHFALSKPANLIVVLTLAIEVFQMASYPLQMDPLAAAAVADALPVAGGGSNDTAGDGAARLRLLQAGESGADAAAGASTNSTAAPTDPWWGSDAFQAAYVEVKVAGSNPLVPMWGAVGAVAVLIATFTAQFVAELRAYGLGLDKYKNANGKDPKDLFFFSFTGAIVYGHGKPKTIRKPVRTVVALLADTLLLLICLRLLQPLACDYTVVARPVLYADSSVVCWEGAHMHLAAASLVALGYMLPLAIMIAPMLMEAPTGSKKKDVRYVKLYLMVVGLVKCAMLVVGALGPRTVTTTLVSSLTASLVLGWTTLRWFHTTHAHSRADDIVERVRQLDPTKSFRLADKVRGGSAGRPPIGSDPPVHSATPAGAVDVDASASGGGDGGGTDAQVQAKSKQQAANEEPRHPFQVLPPLQPCSVPVVNMSKSASYSLSVWSGVCVLVAHVVGTEGGFTRELFQNLLFSGWGVVAFMMLVNYCSWRRGERRLRSQVEARGLLVGHHDDVDVALQMTPFHHHAFVAAAVYDGPRAGAVFRRGQNGLGYYREVQPDTESPSQRPAWDTWSASWVTSSDDDSVGSHESARTPPRRSRSRSPPLRPRSLSRPRVDLESPSPPIPRTATETEPDTETDTESPRSAGGGHGGAYATSASPAAVAVTVTVDTAPEPTPLVSQRSDPAGRRFNEAPPAFSGTAPGTPSHMKAGKLRKYRQRLRAGEPFADVEATALADGVSGPLLNTLRQYFVWLTENAEPAAAAGSGAGAAGAGAAAGSPVQV